MGYRPSSKADIGIVETRVHNIVFLLSLAQCHAKLYHFHRGADVGRSLPCAKRRAAIIVQFCCKKAKCRLWVSIVAARTVTPTRRNDLGMGGTVPDFTFSHARPRSFAFPTLGPSIRLEKFAFTPHTNLSQLEHKG